jgi:predicted DsbA family dithiol-disulfide isomerase
MVGVVGKAIKGFGKALKVAKRNKESKKLFEKSKARSLQKQIESGVVDRNVKSKEVFKTIQGLRKKPKKGINYKKIAIKTAPIGGAAAAGVAYGERKGKK